MYRLLFRNTVTICGAIAVPHAGENLTENWNLKWERVKKIFQIDEFGELSPQLNTMLQTTIFTGFFGSFYGGFIGSREAYLRFIERNEATKFVDHFEAKKKLQQTVTIGFGRGALRWGWRLALFGGFYISFVTMFAAYRGSSSLIDFSLAGLCSGTIYRFNMGFRAMIAGGTLGGMMGMFAGALSTFMFKLTGTSLDEVQQYTHDMTLLRAKHLNEAAKKSRSQEQDILQLHDTIINENKES